MAAAVLSEAFLFPTVIWTVLLIVVLFYWALVAIGSVDVDALGGAQGLDGAGDALAGKMDAAADALAGKMDAAADAVAGKAGIGEGASAFSRLKLRAVPVTLLVTVLVVGNFIVSHAAVHFLGPALGAVMPDLVWRLLVLVGVFFLSLPLASLLVRPLAPLFRTHAAPGRAAAVGKVVEIATGQVNRDFGQARCEDGGAGLILEVRADPEKKLRRGERALVISYDAKTESYEVERYEEVLNKG